MVFGRHSQHQRGPAEPLLERSRARQPLSSAASSSTSPDHHGITMESPWNAFENCWPTVNGPAKSTS